MAHILLVHWWSRSHSTVTKPQWTKVRGRPMAVISQHWRGASFTGLRKRAAWSNSSSGEEMIPLSSFCDVSTALYTRSPHDLTLFSLLIHQSPISSCNTNVLINPKDPTRIAGVIDWDSAATVPFWVFRPQLDAIRHFAEHDEEEIGIRRELRAHLESEVLALCPQAAPLFKEALRAPVDNVIAQQVSRLRLLLNVTTDAVALNQPMQSFLWYLETMQEWLPVGDVLRLPMEELAEDFGKYQ